MKLKSGDNAGSLSCICYFKRDGAYNGVHVENRPGARYLRIHGVVDLLFAISNDACVATLLMFVCSKGRVL